MDIAFCINNGYTPYICVTICSIFENNPNKTLHIHILTDGLTAENTQKLTALIKKYGGKLSVYNIDNKQFIGLNMNWSVYTWYRCVIPKLLPETVQKVLYLDADVVVAGKIDELFERDMTDVAVMAVTDVQTMNNLTFKRLSYEKSKLYFCAGVLMMNVDFWRVHNIQDKVLSWGLQNADITCFPDQDALNVICQDNKIHLPLKFGILHDFVVDNQFIINNKTEIRELLNDARIIHYAGFAPWVYEKDRHFLSEEWNKYAKIVGVKKKHFTTRKGLIKHYIRLFFNKLHLNDYCPYWVVPKQNIKKVKQRLKKIEI